MLHDIYLCLSNEPNWALHYLGKLVCIQGVQLCWVRVVQMLLLTVVRYSTYDLPSADLLCIALILTLP